MDFFAVRTQEWGGGEELNRRIPYHDGVRSNVGFLMGTPQVLQVLKYYQYTGKRKFEQTIEKPERGENKKE